MTSEAYTRVIAGERLLADKQRFAESTVVGVINEINDLADVLADHDSRKHILSQHIHLALACDRLVRLVENMKHDFYAPSRAGVSRQDEKQKVPA